MLHNDAVGLTIWPTVSVETSADVGSDLDARHEQKRRRLNRHTLPEDRRRSTCVQTNGISASVLASGVFRGATLLIEKRSLCRQIRSWRVCKIRAVVLTSDVGPNITSVNTVENEIGGWSSSDSNLSRGALYTTRANQGPRHQSSYRTGWYHMISLDASRSSSSFGRSTSVQPPSARLLVLIKT